MTFAPTDDESGSDVAGATLGVLRSASTRPARSGDSADPFVGREAQLDQLHSRLAAAQAGKGGVVMLVGEAGIGKTRIATEFVAECVRSGMPVLSGRCFESDWHPAYGPWIQAFASYVRRVSPDRLRRQLGQGAPALAQLVAEIQFALPEIGTPDSLGPDEDRLHLFDSVTQFLRAISTDDPTILVLDDLHYADPDSLLLLRYIARILGESPVLLVATYCHPELGVSSQHDLLSTLTVLRREADYLHIGLRGLSLDSVAEYFARVCGLSFSRTVVEAVYAETGGNPFYIREVCRHLLEEVTITGRCETKGDLVASALGIPEGVREAVGRRLARLSDPTRRLLRLAACFIASFDFPCLRVLSDLSDEALLDCVDEALEAGFLWVVDGVKYDFTHRIVRHTLYDELNPDRRAHVHRRIALALERVYGSERDHAADIAAQYEASSRLPDAENGIRYALAAADHANAGRAPEATVAFLRMARDLAAGANWAVRAEILCKLALAEAEAVLLEESSRSAEQALAALTEAGADPVARAEFLSTIAWALKDAGAKPRLWQPLSKQGLALVGERRGLAWARLMLLQERFDMVSNGAVKVGRKLPLDPEAVSIARTRGDEDDYARTLDLAAGWQSREDMEEVLAFAHRWRHPKAIMRAVRIVGQIWLHNRAGLDEHLDEYLRLIAYCEEYGSLATRVEAAIAVGTIRLLRGELELAKSAEERAASLISRLGPDSFTRFSTVLHSAWLAYFLDGNWRVVATEASKLAGGSSPWVIPSASCVSAAPLAYGRTGNALEARRFLDIITPVLKRVDVKALTHNCAMELAANTVWELGLVEFAATYRGLAEEFMAAGISAAIVPHESVIARMDILLGNVEEAIGWFHRARDRAEAISHRPMRAILDFDEALAFIRIGSADRTRMNALLRAALAAFEELNMQGWAARARTLIGGTVTEHSSHATTRARGDALTRREVEVLRLLAAGNTNKEIAAALVVSLPTVQRHVANIYGKIGARGRADAAIYALQQRILSPQ